MAHQTQVNFLSKGLVVLLLFVCILAVYRNLNLGLWQSRLVVAAPYQPWCPSSIIPVRKLKEKKIRDPEKLGHQQLLAIMLSEILDYFSH